LGYLDKLGYELLIYQIMPLDAFISHCKKNKKIKKAKRKNTE